MRGMVANEVERGREREREGKGGREEGRPS